MWFPTGKVVEDDPFLTTIDVEHRPALAVGARLTYWHSERLGVEGAIAYTKSRVESQVFSSSDAQFGSAPSTVDGEVTSYGGRLLWRPVEPGEAAAPHLAVGLAAVSRSSPAYIGIDGTTDLAVVVGAGMRIDLTDRVALRFDLDDYMSSASFVVPIFSESLDETASRFQHDLVLSQSIIISLSDADADAR